MLSFIVGQSELAQRIRSHPWEETELGPPQDWPESLKTLVSMMLAANQQMYVVWGPGRLLIYNDRYIEVLQGHHPDALGRDFLEVWREIVNDLRPLVENAYAGIPTYTDDILLMLERNGYTEETHFAYSYTPVFNTGGGVDGFFCTCIETTQQAKAARLVRENEERQAFLLKFSDALRPLDAPDSIMETATDMLRAQLGASRCAYYEIEGEDYVVRKDSVDGVPSFVGRYKTSDFGDVLRDRHLAGQSPIVVNDVASVHSAAETEKFSAIHVGAYIGVTLVKQSRFVAGLTLQSRTPRTWNAMEVALAQDTAERTWSAVERARSEAALRLSEAEYRRLFTNMGQAYIEVELIRDEEGRATDYRYLQLNPAYERLTGIPAQKAIGRPSLEVIPGLPPFWVETFEKAVTPGTPQRFDYDENALGRWYQIFTYPRGGDRLTVLAEDITDQKRADVVLRESEERQAFLLKLSDGLRPLDDPLDIQTTASRLLAEHLSVNRAMYSEFEGEGAERLAFIRGHYVLKGIPFPSPVPYADFIEGAAGDLLRTGGTLVVEDAAQDMRFGAMAREAWLPAGIASMIAVGLVKNGQEVAHFGVHNTVARNWTPAEVALVREVGDRTWSAAERARAQKALRESEKRMVNLLTLLPVAVYTVDVQGRLTFFNQKAAESWGRTPPLGDMDHRWCGSLRMWLPDGSPLPHDECPMFDAAKNGRSVRNVEVVIEQPGGNRIVANVNIDPLHDSEGHPAGAINVFEDITERKRAEAALRESEQRLSLAIEIGELASWDWDVRSGAVTWNDRHFLMQGYVPGMVTPSYDAWLDRVHPDDRAQTVAQIEAARDTQTVYAHEFRIIHGDGTIRWASARGRFFYDERGAPQRMIGVMEDITDRHEAEAALHDSNARQKVLVAELQHRTRNLIAVVQFIVSRIFANASGLEQAQAELINRLTPLSRVQGLLSRGGEAPITIGQLVHMELDAVGADAMHRVHLSGPDVTMDPQKVQTLTLALHELATNALKHGALADPDGRLNVRWRIATGDDAPRLLLEWVESGLDLDPSAPAQDGYGRELIEKALPYSLGARTSFTLTKTGVLCAIDLPLGKGTS